MAALAIAVVVSIYLLYLTTRSELPDGLIPSAPPQRGAEVAHVKKARAWVEEQRMGSGQLYAEGEVEPEMQGVTLEPMTMHQGRRQEEEVPEKLPETLSSVIAAVNQPFRRTFDNLPSFVVDFSFEMKSSEPKLGKVYSKGTVRFTKDSTGNWHASYNVDTDSPTQTFHKPLYKSQFWLIGNRPLLQRPGDKQAADINEQSPEEDQQLLNSITSGQLDLLSHDLLRRWVNETRQAIGYELAGVGEWLGRPVDQYKTGPSHYTGENPGITVRNYQGTIWIDRELSVPLKAELYYDGVLTIPAPHHYTYDTQHRVRMEVQQIGTAPTVTTPPVRPAGKK